MPYGSHNKDSFKITIFNFILEKKLESKHCYHEQDKKMSGQNSDEFYVACTFMCLEQNFPHAQVNICALYTL